MKFWSRTLVERGVLPNQIATEFLDSLRSWKETYPYAPDEVSFIKEYDEKYLDSYVALLEGKTEDESPLKYDEDNNRRLRWCLYELERLAITEQIELDEWMKIYDEFKDFTPLWNGKKIKLKSVVRLHNLELDIFEEEDGNYVDGRVVANKERAIEAILDEITGDDSDRTKIISCIQEGMWNAEDTSFIPICNKLRDLGYEVEKGA